MICLNIQSIVIVIAVFLKLASSSSHYTQYKLEKLCTTNTFKKIIDGIMDNKPEIKLQSDGKSAAIVYQSFNSSTFKRIPDCEFRVTTLERGPHTGIYVTIKKLNLRKRPDSAECIDYVSFDFGAGKKPVKLCGTTETTNYNIEKKNFLDQTNGPLNVRINIDKFRPLDNIDDELIISLIFTEYVPCPPTHQLVACTQEHCIASDLLNDDINNCPPPLCADEGRANYLEPANDPLDASNLPSIAFSAFTSLTLTMICVLLCWCVCKKRIIGGPDSAHNTSTPNNVRRQSDAEFQTIELPPTTSDYSLNPTAPPPHHLQDDKDPPPSYESLFNNKQAIAH